LHVIYKSIAFIVFKGVGHLEWYCMWWSNLACKPSFMSST